jgi:hypothetical protein
MTILNIKKCNKPPQSPVLSFYAGANIGRLPTGWTVRGSNPGGGGEIFRTCPDWP